MVSDKVIVVLLVLAIVLSLISTVVSLSVNFEDLRSFGGSKTQYVYTPSKERAQVSIVVEEPAVP